MSGLCQGKDSSVQPEHKQRARELSPEEQKEEEIRNAEVAKRKAEVLARYPSLGGASSSLVSDNSRYHLPSKITDIDKDRLEEEKREHIGNARFKEVNGATYCHGR